MRQAAFTVTKSGIKSRVVVAMRNANTINIEVKEDGSVHVAGGGDAKEQLFLRQLGEMVQAAVAGTLQSARSVASADGSRQVQVQKAVTTKGANGF